MLCCYSLLCSAVALRLISGAAGLVGVASPERAYVVAAWISWVVPLLACELVDRLPASRPVVSSNPTDG
jgi:hypothetical protein